MKSIQSLLMLLITLAFVSACSESKTETSVGTQEETMESVKPLYEIAVRMVKDGMKDDFEAKRAAFISLLKSQKGISNDREFQSFYALPQPDEREVFIGMTQYAGPEAIQNAQGNIMGAFQEFASTMDLKAYVYVQPIEGGTFDLGTLAIEEGQVLEVAVRRVKEGQEEAFQSSRKAFVEWLNAQDGVLSSWEFQVVDGQSTDRLTVGMSVYESQEKFQALAAGMQTEPTAGPYFATFDPVALQYAFSTTNQ